MKRLKVLSLAALVAFAACDEGSEPIDPTPVTGTISGVVTIEGSSASGVSVSLSAGQSTTTDGSGAFSFAGVAAGAYTVTISGYASDATFTSTTKAATITSAGQVVTVNFDGAYVRTSAILGSVAAGGQGLAGVSVSIGSASANTDANGQFAFTGLRAGTYTVSISGFDAGQYTFASTSADVTVGVGESKPVSFTGTLIATASISGAITIDGDAAAGVTATLSTGAVATSDASGAYAFSNLTAGNYTVTISGYPADAQFESVAKPVVITSAGSTVTANFAGSYIKTAVITGTVSVAGTGIGGVTVSLDNGTSVNTDANGQYAFPALRAGTYAVTISGWDAGMYTFATTSADVTVALGEAAVQNFAGAYVATAKITGSLYIDEAASNGTFDSTEEKLAVAGIVLKAEGGAVNDTVLTTTDANGDYEFTDLVAGTYRITIQGVTGAPLNAALPNNVAFRAGTATSTIVTVGVGATGSTNWPFNITRQSIKAQVMLGVEGVQVGAAPVTGATVWLYDTYANATAYPAVAGRIGTATTTSAGLAAFNFLRTADVGPSGSVDNIVFAVINTLPANHTLSNTDNVVEIKYNPQDSVTMAPDTFDVVNNRVVVRVRAEEIDQDALNGWTVETRFDPDTTTALKVQTASTPTGDAIFTINRGTITAIHPTNTTFPDTISMRLATVGQPNIQPFTQTPSANEGSAVGSYLRFIWTGMVPAGDTVEMGAHQVKYTQANIRVRVVREQDDTVGWTAGDSFNQVSNIQAGLYRVNANNTLTLVAGPTPAAAGTGMVVFPNQSITNTYRVVATSLAWYTRVLADTAATVMLDGSDPVYAVDQMTGSAGSSTFAFKAINNQITGTVQSRDGTALAGVSVRIKADDRNIEGTKDTTIVTGAGGTFTTNANLIEGPYTVTASANDSIGFAHTLTTVGIPAAPVISPTDVAFNSGAANNTSATVAARDLQGSAVVSATNFLGQRLNTTIRGVVVNDRDSDFNTLDPDEALSGVTVELWQDVDSSSVGAAAPAVSAKDVMVGSTLTGTAGDYEFTGLTEGYYLVRAVSPSNATVLRALAANGTVTATLWARTRAAAGAGATLNQQDTRVVGNKAPAAQLDELPRWDYAGGTAALDGGNLGAGPNVTAGATTSSPTHFIHLFSTGSATGTVVSNAAGNPAVSGIRVTITRCQQSFGSDGVANGDATEQPSPPVAGACFTKHGSPSTHIQNMDTGTDGKFTFTGLLEGVYQIDVFPASAGYTNIVTPAATPWVTSAGATAVQSYLLTIKGPNDIETTPNFIISP